MVVGHFIVSDDVERSRRFYTEVLGGRVVFGPQPTYVALANSFIVINRGGGPTDDKPTVTLETPSDPDRVSSFLNIRVADIHAVYAEWAEPDEGQPEAGGRQAHRLDRKLALAAPVDVLQVQDQRELIQDKRRADTDRQRGERAPAERARAADRSEGSDDQQDDAGDRVMNVRPACRQLVPEWAVAVANHARDRPGQHKRDDESQKAQHQGQLACRDHITVPP